MSIFPHFRRYKKSNHPALIVAEAKKDKEKDSYLYRKTSHSPKLTTRSYDKISPNPNPKDDRPMFIEKRKRVDYKKNFGPKLLWKTDKIKNKNEK